MISQDLAHNAPKTGFYKKCQTTFLEAKLKIGYWFIRKMKISKKELEPVPTLLNKLGNILLKPFINKDLVTHILMGPLSFQLFRVAHNLGLFDYLNTSPGATVDEIAKHLKIDNYPATIVLLGLTGLKILKKINNRYYNSVLVTILTEDKSNAFTHFFPKYMDYAHHILSHGIQHLQEAVVQNKPIGLNKVFGESATDYYYELSKNQQANDYFTQHMSAFSQINAERLSSLKIFTKMQSLLDVGGGSGNVAMSIAACNPGLHITVYDHPSVAEHANANFRDHGLSDRLNAIGADLLTNPFPHDYEGILFSHFIDIFSPEENKSFFQKAHTALKPNGKIIVYTPIVEDCETGPLVNCLLGIYFLCLANGKGRFYSSLQIKNWMQETGFSDIAIERLPSSEAIIIGKKG